MLDRTVKIKKMKKYLLLFITVLSWLGANAQEEYWLEINFPKGEKVWISHEDMDAFFNVDVYYTLGAGPSNLPTAEEKDHKAFITSKGGTIKVYGLLPEFSNKNSLKGCVSIDFTHAKKMEKLTLINDEILETIVLPNKQSLKNLTINNLNKVTSIDMSACETIEDLSITQLSISDLNIGKCSNLKTLDCSNCKLETLVIPEKSAVNKINCSGNSLSEEEVDKLIAALPATGGELCIYDEAAENNNECTAKQVADAKAKNWKVVDATGKDYAGSGAVPDSLNSIKEDSNDNAPYYDLQGRRMQKPTRSGLYIHNGKKVIIK